MNLYLTTCTVAVNGGSLDLFINSHLSYILAKMEQMGDFSVINRQIKEVCSQLERTQCRQRAAHRNRLAPHLHALVGEEIVAEIEDLDAWQQPSVGVARDGQRLKSIVVVIFLNIIMLHQ